MTRQNSGLWYDQPPADYAKALRFAADRSDEQARHHRSEGKPWAAYEISRAERQARRLRAMAALCERSQAERAGDIDFRRLNDASLPVEDEALIVAEIEKTA